MILTILRLFSLIPSALRLRSDLALKNLALRQQLAVLIILAHDRRKIVHFNVTEHPTSAWTARQLLQAFYDRKPARYLIRDRDGIYGSTFQDQVKALDIEEVVTAPRSPWQSPYLERVIGTLRRGCLTTSSSSAKLISDALSEAS